MTTLTELIARVEACEGASREIDRALAFLAGIGTDLERAFYAEQGDAAFVPDQHGLTPMDYKNGDMVRQEWVKGTRRNPGGYKPRLWLNCNGPRPLRSAPAYTASLDAALALVERVLPDAYYLLGRGRVRVGEPLFGAQILDRARVLGEGETDASLPLALCLALLKALQTREVQP